MFPLLFLTAIISNIFILRHSNHFQNYSFLSIPTASNLVLALALSHFYYCGHILTTYLSSNSPRAVSQMVCNTNSWIFSNYCILITAALLQRPWWYTTASGNSLGRNPLLPSPSSLSYFFTILWPILCLFQRSEMSSLSILWATAFHSCSYCLRISPFQQQFLRLHFFYEKFPQYLKSWIIFLMTFNLNWPARFKPTPHMTQGFVGKLHLKYT